MLQRNPSTNRRDFVARLMRDCALSYAKASEVYECFVQTFMDGVVVGSRIRIGRLGVLQPVWHQPKTIHLGCRRVKGGNYEKTQRVYCMDGRYNFKFRLYRKFVNGHELKWYQPG